MKLYDGWATTNFDVNKDSDYLIDQRSGSRKQIGFNWDDQWQPTYSVVGINANKIDSVREAIRDYVNAIYAKVDEIDATAKSDSSFKSEEVRDALVNYVAKVKEWARNLTSDLLAFSDKLGDVKNMYIENMSKMSGTISDTSSSFDAGTEYKETIQ